VGAPISAPPLGSKSAERPVNRSPETKMISEPAVRAPEFQSGLDWINTGGRALTLADLRGRLAILDFWTYG
jgi:hypothetical protein